ncbi:hypothetical protein [Cytobacillus praedii]|uniref:hypothetical protein n=1 Tax=Cytobacillus praedii TaxID=1742358 RepID=UPI00070A611A|nr:hypothetical protein [Cytobacillus praedii]
MRDKYTDKRKLDRQIRKLTKIVDSKFTNKNFLKKKTRRIVNEHMRNDGNKPVIEIPEQLDLMGRLLVKTHENIERQNISRRTRKEWEEEEIEFIPPEPIEIPEDHRVCECWNCKNTFPIRGKKIYCSPECSQEQQDANKRLRKTGTFLCPKRDNYKPNREENTGIKDRQRMTYTDDIEKYRRIAKRKETGNRTHSPNRNPDKPAPKVKLRMGEQASRNIERQKTYEAFIRGQASGIFTVDIKSGLKIFHANGKEHEYSEEDSSIGA